MIRLTIIIMLCATLTIVYSVGLNEEFTWTRITYRWPKPGPSERPIKNESRSSGKERFGLSTENYYSIVFEEQSNALGAGNTHKEPIPKFIDYIYGKSL